MENISLLDTLWIIVASALVFVMQAGFAMVESGLTRSKNSINVAIKNLTDLGASLLSYWLFGFGLMFGVSLFGFFGGSNFLFEPLGSWGAVFFLFHAMFCSTSATIVSGAVAERMRYSSYIISTVLLSLILYPVFGHWVWGGALQGEVTGWLGAIGFVDFAGSTVVHSLGGWVALAILLIIGSRTGRFQEDGRRNDINGSNIPMVVLGVILLWFGWFGFNGGSTLSMSADVPAIILKTSISAAAGMIGSLAIGWPLRKRPDATLVMNGALAGLVAITAAVHVVSVAQSLLIGLVGGAVMLFSEELLWRLKIDDAVSAIPVHLSAGIWGTLAVGIFGDLDTLGTGLSRLDQIGVQALGIVACGIWAFTVAFLFLKVLNAIPGLRLRVTPEEEQSGLNMVEHGVTTEILDLYVTMDSQRRTGDLTLRAPIEPFTEAGQIASMYNQVLDNLEENTVEKSAYLDILHNVTDGIFILHRDGTIGPHYSTALGGIFNSKSLAGVELHALMDDFLGAQKAATLGDFLDLCFDASVSWRQCEKLNPLTDAEFAINDSSGATAVKHLNFQFKRIVENDEVRELLVMVRDTTRQKKLSREIEQAKAEKRSEMELLYKTLHIEPEIMMDYLKSLDTELRAINTGFQSEGIDHRRRLERTFMHTHTIKGEAELLMIDFIAEKAEQLEVEIQAILAKDSILAEDFLALTLIFSDLQRTAANVKDLLGKWLNMDTDSREGLASALDRDSSIIGQLQDMTNRLGMQYDKQVKLVADPALKDLLARGESRKLKTILVQLIRNAVYHGIETPDERDVSGKNREGRISIHLSERGDQFSIRVRDDGSGLQPERLRKKALEYGLIKADGQRLSDADAVKAIFSNGFSTAEKPDRIAGKGVGMGLIRSLVSEMNGSLSIRSKPREFTDFILDIPKEALTKEAVT